MTTLAILLLSLLHCSWGFNVHEEILTQLEELQGHTSAFTFDASTLRVPSSNMINLSCDCEPDFIDALMTVLKNVKRNAEVHEDNMKYETIIRKLISNLNHLKTKVQGKHPRKGLKACEMEVGLRGNFSRLAKKFFDRNVQFIQAWTEDSCQQHSAIKMR